jgi:hypothetical protein
MTTITQQKVLTGLLEDEKQIQRQVSSAVSQLKVQTDLMAHIAAYLFTNPEGLVDSEYLVKVTAAFQEQLVPLLTEVLPKLQAIEACGNEADGAANLDTLITTYGLTPETFSTRYK